MGVREWRAAATTALWVALAVLVLCSAGPARAEDAPPPVATPPVATPPVEPPAEAPAPTVPVVQVIAAGVTIAGQPVGGLTAREAVALVRERFDAPLRLVVSPGQVREVPPAQLGARARVTLAVGTALTLGFAFDVPLWVEIDENALRRRVERLRPLVERAPRDSTIVVRGQEPHLTPARPGRTLKSDEAVQALRGALETHDRSPLALPFTVTQPRVTEAEPGMAIIVLRETRRLSLFRGERLLRTFRVATGLPSYPTPLGRWRIVLKERDPWWNPPPGSDWAKDKPPVPPGPGNPLGTRWMGLDAQYVGIHGTPDAASIGYSASHGCIRMLIPEVEWLFDRVPVGTPVFILSV